MAKTRIEGKSIEEQVKGIIVDQLSVDESEVTLGSSLRDDLDADSLDLVEIVMILEEAFDIQISDEDGDKMKTVADAVKIVEGAVK